MDTSSPRSASPSVQGLMDTGVKSLVRSKSLYDYLIVTEVAIEVVGNFFIAHGVSFHGCGDCSMQSPGWLHCASLPSEFPGRFHSAHR